MSVGKPLKSEFSVPFSFLVFLNVIAIDFQNLLFWGLVSPGQAVRVGVPELELEFLIPQGGSVPLLSLPTVTCHSGAFSLVSLCLRLPSRLDAVLLSSVVEALFIPYSGPFQRELFHKQW